MVDIFVQQAETLQMADPNGQPFDLSAYGIGELSPHTPDITNELTGLVRGMSR